MPPAGVLIVPQWQLEPLASSPRVVYPKNIKRGYDGGRTGNPTLTKSLGTVILGVTISADGKVEKVGRLSGDDRLAVPTMETLQQMAFQPYLVDGQPTRVWSMFEFSFLQHFQMNANDGGIPVPTSLGSEVASGVELRPEPVELIGPGVMLPPTPPAPTLPAVAPVTTRPLKVTLLTPEEARLKDPRSPSLVMLQLTIGKNGSVKDVIGRSPAPRRPYEVVRAAITAVRKWHYPPYEVNGKRIEYLTLVTVEVQ